MRFLSAEQILSANVAPAIASGAIHVWPFELSGPPHWHGHCLHTLSPAELERANRFVFEQHRLAFVFAHGQMRHLLALYAASRPAALQFIVGDSGKPALAPHQPSAAAISFNLSHSAGRALLAVSGGPPVGVDLEQVRSETDALGIAGYFFGSELDALQATPAPLRQQNFFRLWTAKEAVLKGQGTGLALPLNAFRVAFAPDGASAQVESFDASRLDADWFVRTLPCEPGWCAAVASRTSTWRVEVMGQAAS